MLLIPNADKYVQNNNFHFHCLWQCKIICHFGRQFDSSYKTKYIFTMWISNCTLVFQMSWKLVLHKHTYTHTHKIYPWMLTIAWYIPDKTWKQIICHSLDEWINNLSFSQRMEHYFSLKINELVRHEKTWRQFTVLSEKRLCEGYILYDFKGVKLLRRQNDGSVMYHCLQGIGRKWEGWEEHRGISMQWKHFVWHYTGGINSNKNLYNPKKTVSRWNSNCTMVFGFRDAPV